MSLAYVFFVWRNKKKYEYFLTEKNNNNKNKKKYTLSGMV